ncbi:hypothetical protein IMZ31_23695 (plasmid) [Pontibacillus sp. ALD_SL1]|uniref:hypothetical protein n=1 Tax=Pontibacillus sp. ALD_SL1 TaxID=2777185 RepID=UPI001A979FA3|nr:hypothetical protein [Pontibacillus sp. ALD_SL1]QST02456.1 hypothetical protein IMZ31_23695 [Pontibacillus sp. ALD_SL1]
MDMREYLSDFLEEAIFYDGLDEAIIGYGERCGLSVVLYDAIKCMELFVKNDGMTEEEAVEHFEYNILGAYLGEHTPICCYLDTE